MSLLHTVVSAYEVQDIVQLMHESDEKAIINVIPTENFFGGFFNAQLNKKQLLYLAVVF
ncbi:MAG: DUF2179 domain-containing protein [Thomasclavelia ramosa]